MSNYPYKATFDPSKRFTSRLMKALNDLGERSVTVTGLKPGCVSGFASVEFPEDIQKEHRITHNLGVRESVLIKD